MSLNTWQERLDKHFAQLRERRLSQQSEHAVLYALEHGLTEAELAQLRNDIHEWLTNSGPARRHFLAWAVYSAEVGYEYSGEEYWTTFCSRTPNWQDSSHYRDHIREAFREFQRNFNAAEPHGPWAEQFTIICWPITHAILPKDLQRELAYILYELRGSFTSGLLHNAQHLGQRIEDASWNSGARFRQFAEDHTLVGQIASALLLNDEEKDKALILPSTLNRIASDLDRNQRSREWLRDARKRANQVRVRGLSRSAENAHEIVSATGTVLTPQQREVLELGLEPNVVLHRTGEESWIVRLELPNLAPLVQRFPRLRDVIANERCVVAGVKGGALPRGYLLWGTQTVTMSRWPASDEVLLKFENFDPELSYLLTMECLLRPGPTWLFKISPDRATAVHVRTGVVQPGCEYILIARSDSGLLTSTLYASPTTVDCQGISATRLTVPEVISEIYQEQLHDLALVTSSAVHVAPAGIPPTRWDDTGTAEWLSTNNPLIAISANCQIQGILLNLVGPNSNKLELDGATTWPLLVDLGKLDPGLYNLHVLISRHRAAHPIFGRLQFTIREPRPWVPVAPAATPFSARVSPAVPSLEELWEARAVVELLGPPNRKAEVTLTFYSTSSTTRIYQESFGPIALPCSSTKWLEHWSDISGNRQIQNAYDASSECELTVTCEELGRFSLRSVREPRPARWIVRQGNSGYELRLALLNDQVRPTLARYAFRSPAEFTRLEDDVVHGFRVSDDGGLFAASTDRYRDAVIVPPAIHSFKWLSAEVAIPQLPRSETSLGQLIRALELWTQARAVGNPFAIARKRAAIDSLQNETVRILCGDEWARYENQYHQERIALADLRGFVSNSHKHIQLPRELLAKQNDLKSSSLAEIADILDRLVKSHLDLPIFSTARDHGVSRQKWIIEFAYRLFMSPESICAWATSDFVPGIGYLLKNSVLARFARLAQLASAPNGNGIQRKALPYEGRLRS
jgi:hypothetical protein